MNLCHNETIAYKRWRFHKSYKLKYYTQKLMKAPSFISNRPIMAKIHIIIGLKITEILS